MIAPHLETLNRMARVLVSPDPLVDRLRDLLKLLQAAIPYVGARIIVLARPAWTYSVPEQPTSLWPASWTSQLLQTREPLIRTAPGAAHYLGWPVGWGDKLWGALELLVPPNEMGRDDLPLLDAIVPLLASAIASNGTDLPTLPNTPAGPEATVPPSSLAELQTQLEAPLLLEPLAQTVLQWTIRHLPVQTAALHLWRSSTNPGHQAMQFVLPVNPSLPPSTIDTFALASFDQPAPLFHRNGNGLECAVPIGTNGSRMGALVVIGRQLEREQVDILTAAGHSIAAALQRALVYQQMTDAHAQLQQIFTDLPTGLALTDHDGHLLHANPGWAQLWGVPDEAISPGQLVPWDMFEPLLARLPDPIAFDQFFRQSVGKVSDATLTLQQPHQELRVLRIPIKAQSQQPSLLLYVLSDVTREREAERAKSEFVSVVSHELRTPLTSILGYAELLKAREFPAADRMELIDTVWKQAMHLSTLVEDLLNVSRLDAGRITLSRWVLSIRQLVTELIAQMNKQLDQQRHQLLIDIDNNLPPIYADRDRVRQVLSNLLSNAIKYSPEGGEIVLRAELLRQPPPHAPTLPPVPALLLSVRDPGMGIDPAEQNRIFERFYRIDNSNTRRIGGTGLGLAITKALVELHGGRIWVTSQIGEGSIFWLTLPLATDVIRTSEFQR